LGYYTCSIKNKTLTLVVKTNKKTELTTKFNTSITLGGVHKILGL